MCDFFIRTNAGTVLLQRRKNKRSRTAVCENFVREIPVKGHCTGELEKAKRKRKNRNKHSLQRNEPPNGKKG